MRTHEVDVEGGGCPTANSCAINLRTSFLPSSRVHVLLIIRNGVVDDEV